MFSKSLVKIIAILASLSIALTATLVAYGEGDKKDNDGSNKGSVPPSSTIVTDSSTESSSESDESKASSIEKSSSEAGSSSQQSSSSSNSKDASKGSSTSKDNSKELSSEPTKDETTGDKTTSEKDESGKETVASKNDDAESETEKDSSDETSSESDVSSSKDSETSSESKVTSSKVSSKEKETSSKKEKNPSNKNTSSKKKEEVKPSSKAEVITTTSKEPVQSQVTSYYTPSYDAGSATDKWEGDEETELEETSSVRELSTHLVNPKKELLKWIWLPILIALACIGALIYINVYVYGNKRKGVIDDENMLLYAHDDDFVYLEENEKRDIFEEEEIELDNIQNNDNEEVTKTSSYVDEHAGENIRSSRFDDGEEEDDPYSADNFFHFDND